MLVIMICQSDFIYEVLISREVTASPESGHGEAKVGNHDLPIGSKLAKDHFKRSHSISEYGHGEPKARKHNSSKISFSEHAHFKTAPTSQSLAMRWALLEITICRLGLNQDMLFPRRAQHL